METFKSFNPVTVDTYIHNKKRILLSTFVVEVEIIDIILVIVSESTGVDWVTLYVWVSKVLGSFAEDVIFIETDLSAKLLEGVMLRANTVWVKEGVVDKLTFDDVIFSDERTDVGVTEETTDTFVVNMTLLLFILDVTATELEVNIESLGLAINVGNGREV